MRAAILIMLLVMMAAPAGAQQRQPAPPPPAPWGWEVGADGFTRTFADADQRNGYSLQLLNAGCDGAAFLICSLELRGVPIRLRASLPDRRITEVEVLLSSRASTMNNYAALYTLLAWAEPTSTRDARRQVVQALVDSNASRSEATIGRTRLVGATGFRGFIVTASPAP